MGLSPNAAPGKTPALVAHCSWGRQAEKRWMALATRSAGRWTVSRPEPLGAPGELLGRLQQFAMCNGPVLLGLDFPIGLPRHYGALTGLDDFPTALKSFGSGPWADWYMVCDDPRQISIHRPFYPSRPYGRRRRDLLDGLGLGSQQQLLRQCEGKDSARPTASGLFWTLGPAQVGARAVSGWQEMLVPWLGKLALWPFDGPMSELLKQSCIVVAETFPGAYHHSIGLPDRSTWSQKTRTGRLVAAGPLLVWFRKRSVIPAEGLREVILNGFGDARGADAAFDALVGLIGMLDVVEIATGDDLPDDPGVCQWEGWIFGQPRGSRVVA